MHPQCASQLLPHAYYMHATISFNRHDPVKLNRLKRKREKKARWSNFYKTVEVTNEILTPPVESDVLKGNKDSTEAKVPEPELDDDKVTLSWYDSDLNQYLILPELNSVVPLSDGAFSHAWAGARASHGVTDGRVCYEVSVGAVVTTTESSEKEPIVSGLRVGWSTDNSTLHLGEGELSWGYESNARAVNNGEFKEYGQQLQEKDVVGVYLDLESTPCKISYTVNGIEQGVAFEFPKESLQGRPMFPHVLTKNTCYRINLGHDRYNMLTKTKIVRKRLEIPIEEVIEEKRKIEAELQRQKEELERMEKEKKEKEKKEREERQRKRKEERERQDKERKEKEAQERKERGEEVEETEDKQDDNDKEKQADNTDKEDEQPKENGDKPEEESQPEPEVKPEPMETETTEDEKPTAPESAVAVGEVIEVTEEQVLKGQITLDKRVKFVTRYTVEEELEGAEACLVPGYSFIGHAPAQPGPRRPAARADCEVILMVGMPGSGKTYWARQHAAAHPDKRYNIISTGALFDRMKVDCKPFRSSYEGRWDAMVSKCAKCVLKLLEIAKGRRRNYILDQTNVYPSAQRRKLKEFDGYRRVAVVIVTDEETYKERHKRREEADGKEVPDGAIVDMKANFTLPEKSTWLDEVLYPELGEEEAKAVVEALHKEAKAAGVGKEREKRDRSGSRDGPSSKRARDDRRHRDDRRSREFQRDREDRWGIGGGSGGGSRWGPAGRGGGGAGGGGGGRWGSRERAGPAPAGGPPQRFDRWGPPNRNTDFSRDREDFRGGRGAPGGRGGPGGRGPGGPPGGPRDRGMGPQGMDGRFRGPDRNNRGPPPDKRQAPPGAQSGSWQRGGAQPQNRSQPRPNAPPGPRHPNQKEGQMQSSQSPQQGWNQWAGGWGGWGNWNQNQAGWGNWGNWGNWNPNASGQGGQSAGKGQAQAQVQGQQQTQTQTQTQGQWPANYTAQQWYQWQQWQQQQQQQGWPGYQQGAQQSSAGAGGNAAEQAWAQYYQNYGAGNAANAALGAAPAADNK